jgi:hypothetical protein
MCAVDALGVASMLRTGAVITTNDPITGASITITVELTEVHCPIRRTLWSSVTEVVGRVQAIQFFGPESRVAALSL